MSDYVRVCAYVLVEVRGHHQALLQWLPTLFFEKGSLTEPEAH